VTEFGEYLHGEAVAIGMMGAATIGTRLGMIDEELVDRQRRVFTQFGLPLAAPGLDADAIVAATKADKKSRGGAIRWVMLEDPGRATTRQDVPDELVADVVRELVHLD
ncbi:MAG: hypothetical protein QGF59_01020, partial [Pirellulaceae bacterium]|nr:hypothetical protein [Pirellulaceae bacterium]